MFRSISISEWYDDMIPDITRWFFLNLIIRGIKASMYVPKTYRRIVRWLILPTFCRCDRISADRDNNFVGVSGIGRHSTSARTHIWPPEINQSDTVATMVSMDNWEKYSATQTGKSQFLAVSPFCRVRWFLLLLLLLAQGFGGVRELCE
jgi:hypothetical protein